MWTNPGSGGASNRWIDTELDAIDVDHGSPSEVRKTPSWPRSWGNFSLLSLYSYRNAWANLHLLGQSDTSLAREGRPLVPRLGRRAAWLSAPARGG